jgi:hypothetical protein
VSRAHEQAGPVGLVVAACAACCAGPVVAALGVGTMVAIGLILTGAVAAGIIVFAVVALVAWKRRRQAAHDAPPDAVPLELRRR